jgi:hypothetical protein
MLKAAYRFFTNDDIAPDDMLQSHIEATYSRLYAVPLVLAVQDTTEATGRTCVRPQAWARWDAPRVKACWSIPR